jgi:uncharacterized protein YdiU (UPF0061 family)
LIAQWMNVGFIHGVMNTDNMTISGETIDYGPCAFMEAYDPKAVFSSIDEGGRYAYANQPLIAQWNLARLAEALLPLVVQDDRRGGRRQGRGGGHHGDRRTSPACTRRRCCAGSARSWGWRRTHRPTMPPTRRWRTTGWACCRRRAWTSRSAGGGWPTPPRARRAAAKRCSANRRRCASGWRAGAALRPDAGVTADRAARMRRVNPWIIPRNHRVEEALDAATQGDLAPFESLLAALRDPYTERPEHAAYAEPAPAA